MSVLLWVGGIIVAVWVAMLIGQAIVERRERKGKR